MNRQIKKVFESYDIDDVGYLNGDSLYKALSELHLPVQPEDIPDIFESVGRRKEKTIELEDFADIVVELRNQEEEEDEEDHILLEEQKNNSSIVYQMLEDSNIRGITYKSLLKVCAAQEPSWTNQQVLEMLNEADSNHDGVIDLQELKAIFKKVGLE